jgi:hypothetical protein
MDDRPDPSTLSDSAPKQRVIGRPWKKGESGNPRGNWRRTPHYYKIDVRELISPAAPKIIKKILAKAEAGDEVAQRMFCQYLLPQGARFVSPPIDLGPASSAREACEQIALVASRAASGQLDLSSMHALVSALTSFIAAYRETELESRLIDIDSYAGPIEDESDVAGPQAPVTETGPVVAPGGAGDLQDQGRVAGSAGSDVDQDTVETR